MGTPDAEERAEVDDARNGREKVKTMSDELESLENVLSGADASKGDDLPDEPDEVTEKVAETEKQEEEDSTPESKAETDDQSWTKAMALDERRKRQAAEEELRELRKKVEQNPEKPEATPDVLDDPEGFTKSLEQKFSQKLLEERISLSRAMMEDSHEDYAEMESVFVTMAKEDPALAHKMQQHPFPAKFAYEQAKKHQEFQQMQDVDAYKAKLREEVRKEVEEELKAKLSKQAEKADSITPSLAKSRSAKDEPVVDESLEDVIGQDATRRR